MIQLFSNSIYLKLRKKIQTISRINSISCKRNRIVNQGDYMSIVEKRANTEVLVILEKLNMLDKIPENVLLTMKNNRDEKWNFIYDDNLMLEEQNITKETAVLLSTIYLMYICEDQEEKEELKQIYENNEETLKQNRKNSLEEVLGKKEEVVQLVNIEKKETIFEKIKKWIKSIFVK